MKNTNRSLNALPLRNVLCPMDLSPISLNALEWSNAVARPRNAELRMLHVVATEGIVAVDHLGFNDRENMIQTLRETLQRIDPTNPKVGAAIRQGEPGNQILQFARSMPADLIVMGAAGAERPERPIGSITATVVARSDCGVMIVPSRRHVNAISPASFEHIVCAVDVTPASVTLMRQAISLAWETHGRVMLLCVMIEPDPSSSEIQQLLVDAIPPEARTWCDIDIVVKRGVPATEIVRVVEKGDVDLLVIGPPRRWTSTTQAVLAKSLCPVLVAHDARPLPYPTAARRRTRQRTDRSAP
jgi:nucleotide-binding universal stress UspA family protein